MVKKAVKKKTSTTKTTAPKKTLSEPKPKMCNCNCKWLYVLTLVLLIVGGLNWLLVAFNFNLVSWALGSIPILMDIVYGLVGASAIIQLIYLFKK
jgi:uncharacterized protein